MIAYGFQCVCKGYFAVNKIADFASVICKKRRNSALRQSGNSCGKAYVIVLRKLSVFANGGCRKSTCIGIVLDGSFFALAFAVLFNGLYGNGIFVQ